MAKGKHAPAPGAVRKDKVIHPHSRKAQKMQSKAEKRHKLQGVVKSGGLKLQALGERLQWFRENLPLCLDEGEPMSSEVMLNLAEAFLSRFQEELDQIAMKNSIGGKNKRKNHQSRIDVIEFTMKTEKEEFEGCGVEMPDLFDQENLTYFQQWDGELRFVQNIKMARFKRVDLESKKFEDGTMETE